MASAAPERRTVLPVDDAPKDPLEHLSLLRETAATYVRKAEDAYARKDWKGVDAMSRALACLRLEAKHAEIDFCRQHRVIPPLNNFISKRIVRDCEGELDVLDSMIVWCRETRAKHEAKLAEKAKRKAS